MPASHIDASAVFQRSPFVPPVSVSTPHAAFRPKVSAGPGPVGHHDKAHLIPRNRLEFDSWPWLLSCLLTPFDVNIDRNALRSDGELYGWQDHQPLQSSREDR